METYSLLRQFADSWMLLLMLAAFAGVVLYIWRPQARKAQHEAAMSIFRNETHPAASAEQDDADQAARSHLEKG